MGFFSNLFGSKVSSNLNEVADKVNTQATISGLQQQKNTVSTGIKKGMVNVAVLNARQKPSADAKVLFKLKKNTIVNVKETVGEWYHITTEVGDAYCMSKYINIQQQIEKLLVEAEALNVRSFYSTDSSIIGKVYRGNILIKLSKHNEWYGVDFKGKKGFVNAAYVTPLSDDGTSTSTSGNTKKQSSNTTTETRVFFNTRKDLEKVELAPKKLLSSDGLDKYGKVAVKTWNNYGNLISTISKELGIDVEIALAVICVESGGNGFASDGKMLIRFENHVFHTYFGSKSEENQKIFDEHFSFNPKKRREDHKYRLKKSDEWIPCHTGQASEWAAFNLARSIAETQALYSISMGAPQVMGFNYKMIGYTSAQEMFNTFSKDIRYHIMALFDFCNAKSTRVQYLLTGDFLSFAKEYNGLTAPEAYESRLQQYYEIYKSILK
jgi:uncharacterized protein YgiM (DUF1202 family)